MEFYTAWMIKSQQLSFSCFKREIKQMLITKYSPNNTNNNWKQTLCPPVLSDNILHVINSWRPAVSSVAKRTLSVREVWGSIPGPVKSAQCRQRLATVATFLRSCVAQALSRGDGPRNSLHASAYYGEYNEDLIWFWFDQFLMFGSFPRVLVGIPY